MFLKKYRKKKNIFEHLFLIQSIRKNIHDPDPSQNKMDPKNFEENS